MLGLPDRESSPEEVDDDDNGLKCLFWMPPDMETHLMVLGLHLLPQSLRPPA
jgi:hypothetical protein